jgi:hypothetical protein
VTYKVWSTNEVLTSTDLNNVAKQQVIGCTTGTRPSSPPDGMMTYETDAGPGMFRYREAGLAVWRSICSTFPVCMLTKGTASIANNTVTTVTSWTEVQDDWGMYPGGAASGITVPYTGIYSVNLEVRWASQATVVGFRQCRIDVGGVEQMIFNLAPTTALNATNVMTQCCHVMQLTAAEVIEGKVYQNSGAALDMIANSRITVNMLREGA